MNEPRGTDRLQAFVDGRLDAADAAAFERTIADDAAARAEVDALRAQNAALHARYDAWLDAPHGLSVGPERTADAGIARRTRVAIAASVALAFALGVAGGWSARGRDARVAPAATVAGAVRGEPRDADLAAFVRTAARSHALFVPEARHPVEVPASDEAHLVAWLSKRLDAPVTVPHLGEAGWTLLGGRLLPGAAQPVAQFMYQDARGRRLTLAVSHPSPATAARAATPMFRIAEEDGDTVFYWVDADWAYALTGALDRAEMTALARRVHDQLDASDAR